MGADLDPLLTLLTLLSAVLPTSCSTPAPPRTFWIEDSSKARPPRPAPKHTRWCSWRVWLDDQAT
jgi:hypothetical protein